MTKFKKTQYRFWHSPIALLILFCVFCLFVYNVIDLIKKERETANKKQFILNQIKELQDKEKMLSGDIAKLETPEGKEEVIREKYRVVKEGEKMVTIVNEEDGKDITIEENGENSSSFTSFFKKIFKK